MTAAFRRSRLIVVVLALALPLAAPAAGRPEAPPPAELIGLKAFVQLTVLRNLTVASAQLQAQSAERLADAQRALYDPAFFARLRRDEYDRPRTYEERTVSLTNIDKASAIEGVGQAGGGLRGKLPTGAVFEVSHDLRRRQSNLLASLDERENRGTLTLTLRQPLLRNAGRSATEADLTVAELEQAIERQKAVKQLIDTIGEAAGTYWQLYRAATALALRQSSLEHGRALCDDVRRRVDGGFAPRTDLAEAEVMLGYREAEVVRARQQLAEARARVRNLLNQPIDAAAGGGIAAADAPGEPQAPEAADPARLDAILETWPGYQIARLRYEQEDLRWRHARNQALPDVVLEVGYNQNSLSPGLRAGVRESLRDLHPGWYVGLSVEVPLGNRQPASRLEAQRLRRESARLQMEAEGTMTGNEWVTRVAQARAAQDELALLRREVEARERLAAAERMNHERGRVRLAQLLDSEARLEDSRVRRLDAEVRVQLAQLSVLALTGRLGTAFDVAVTAAP